MSHRLAAPPINAGRAGQGGARLKGVKGVQKRVLGKTGGEEVSLLGFGCMRLPTLPGGGEVDESEAVRIIRHGIERGINYVDTAYNYHGGAAARWF